MNKSCITSVAKKVCPAAITIVVSKDLPKISGFFAMPMGGEDIMMPSFEGQKEKTKVGGGSGFLITKDGYIVTCNHVVADPDSEYTVLLDPEKKYTAKVIARDPMVDLAILKIEGYNFPFIKMHPDSRKIELGEQVLAVGNPLGEFDDTISLGIVSGLSRRITAYGGNAGATSLHGLIQTDAAINPGNSGGPLVNMKGTAIGVNSAMVSGAQNLGFAIPINYVKEIFEEVIKYGKIKRPFLGIRYFVLNPEIAKRNKINVDHGALIVRERLGEPAVLKDSPAGKAGLKEFDIVLKCNGIDITEKNTLNDILQNHKIGDQLAFTVLRDEKEIIIPIQLEEKKEE
ncbi:MAG TPA: trypsin-like peptidase domain-containing protein [Candidatus Pacearchaeota archaeon]|nr:trypsin-like peptidase domain-containing protein [Candidatus Pacearchaeota archaeon]